MNPLIRAIVLTAVGAASALGALPAQEKVLSKQEQATRDFEKLKERMQRLRVTLKNTDPDKAKVLGLGVSFIQEKAITTEMKAIQELLGEEAWDDAIERCQRVVKDLNTLIELLLKGDQRIEDILKEIERLKAFKEKVEKLIADEKAEKDESARAEALEQHVKNLEKAKQDLEDLIADQKDVREEANKSGLQAEPDKAGSMAKKESGLKDRADKLAKDIQSLEQDAKDIAEMKPGEGKPGEGKPGEGKPGEAKPGEAKPGEAKPGEAKPGEAKPGEAKPGEAKPGEAKPGEAKPGEAKPGEAKPGEGEPGDGEAGDGKAPESKGKGASAASGASQEMDKAAGKLQDNRPESSLENMDKAIEKLDAAKKELEKQIEDAKRELLKLPFELLAKKQEQTKIETDKLAEEMEKSESEQGEGQGKPTPGKQNVQQSVPKMKSAAGSLKEYKAGKAKQDQQDAQDALEKAQKALDDALAQLRQQLQDEVLRSLEERFGEMLAKQKKISAKTRLIEAQKGESLTASGEISSALKKRTGIQAVGELELSAEANSSLKLLEEDGTTAVFPDFIIEVREDLKKVAKRLNAQKTDKATQTMQKEIEDMLEMLIDALRQQIEQNESNGGEP